MELRITTKSFISLLTLGMLSGGASAETLRVSLAAKISSMDPHYQSQSPNAAMSRNIFDTLVIQDSEQVLKPGLAESWKAIDDTTWEFKLRQGVKFHDGSPFTSADVAYTIKRIPTLNSPGSLERYVRQITEVQTPDPYTIRMRTREPFPLMPTYMSGFVIVSKKATEEASAEDFNTGKATIGTGPFKFKSWVPGDNVQLVRNDDYWNGKSDFEQVNIRFVPDDGARITQLLTGETDFVDQVPPQLAQRVSDAKNVKLNKSPSYRLIYLGLNFADPGGSANVTDLNGTPLPKNPLLDLRVRQAISKAIDRKSITERIMGGYATPATQINLKAAGASPNVPADFYDLEGAKKLIAEAGFPNGFSISFIAPNDSYINDAQVAQAVSQMLARIGIRVRLETLPSSVMFQRMNDQKFGLFMYGHGATTGEPSGSLSNLVATFDRKLGQGSSNRGRYSNPSLDALIQKASTTMDDRARAAILVEAIDLTINDGAIIPLQHQAYVTAMRSNLEYEPRVDERFLAANVKLKK